MAIPQGSTLEFQFPDTYDPLLTTYDKRVRVLLVKNVTDAQGKVTKVETEIEVTVKDRVLKIPF